MAKKKINIEKNNNGVIYFINNCICTISSLIYMLYVSITSVAIFPVVKQTQELTDDVMLETIYKAAMFILRNFMSVLIMTIIFLVINYFVNKKNNKKYSWGLLIFFSLVLVINLVRVIMFYI